MTAVPGPVAGSGTQGQAVALGQVAYEAYCRHVDRISPPPWEHLHSGYQDGWQEVAHAVIAAWRERSAAILAEPDALEDITEDDDEDGCECGSPACRRSAPYADGGL